MRFSTIKDNDIANGVGVNMSLWTQGCRHKCKGCFNKETWDYNGGKEFTNNDLHYILNNIDKYGIKRNLSILGGEPLCPENVEGVLDLCKKFKKLYPDKTIYLWTGYLFENLNPLQLEVLEYVDVLVDGKFEIDKKDLSLKYKGSSNQRVINVKETLELCKVVEIKEL